jgi:hypothetical protein
MSVEEKANLAGLIAAAVDAHFCESAAECTVLPLES